MSGWRDIRAQRERDRMAGRVLAALFAAASVAFGVVAALPRTPGTASAVLAVVAVVTAVVTAAAWRSSRPGR